MSNAGGEDWSDKKPQSAGSDGGDDREDAYQLRQDTDHLKILSIIWYVMSGLSLIGVCLGLLYTLGGMGVAAAGGQDAAAGGIFLCVGIAVLVFSLLGGLLNFLVARNLQRRKGHLFCMIISGIICLNFPLGTALGVFTIMVLLRPTVKKAFGVS